MPSAPGTRIEYGDFQTPLKLATRVASMLAHRGLTPCSVLDPTCGVGGFVEAAIEAFLRRSGRAAGW